MNSKEIICKFASTWEENKFNDFTEIFAENALIYHPYFQKPITATQAMEVMNTAVSGTSKVESFDIVEGNGDGINDKIRIKIYDTGTRVSDVCYVGVLPILISIQNKKIINIHIEKGFYKKINEKRKTKVSRNLRFLFQNRRNYINKDSTLAIAIKLAKYWGTNYYREFISLFSASAKIKHILYEQEAIPEVIVDVMNSNVLGTTELYGYEILRGDGSGKKDAAFLKFIETGDMIGYIPDQQGVMKIKVYIEEHKITYLDVQGYEIVNVKESEA